MRVSDIQTLAFPTLDEAQMAEIVRFVGASSLERLRAGETVARVDGDQGLRSVELVNHRTGATRTIQTPALFSFIGAVPRTEWLRGAIDTDAEGFILTGPRETGSPQPATCAPGPSSAWPLPSARAR